MLRRMALRSSRFIFYCLAVAVFSLFFLAPSNSGQTTPSANSPGAASSVVEIPIDGEIEPILADYVVHGIEQAATDHASLILITIDTPGGLDSSMRAIIQAILRSTVPVVVYVSPAGSRAASAGFYILLSSDIAAMSPGTESGAASPIMEIGGQVVQIDDTLRKKIVNDATAYLRSYSSKRGRNVDLAMTAVTDAKAFSDKEALDGKLIDIVTASKEDLLAQLNGRTITRFDGTSTSLALAHPVVSRYEMSGREKFLARIVQPDVFFILLIVGVLGLYVEFTHPGAFAPGVIGGIAIALAMALFILEAKFPTHGVLGVGGVVSMVLGALFLIRSPLTGMGVSLWTALAVVIPFAVIVIILMRLVLRSRTWKVSTGKEELIGEVGEVRETLGSREAMGSVFVHGELWRAAVRAGESIPAGARVRVSKVKGLTLEVELVESH